MLTVSAILLLGASFLQSASAVLLEVNGDTWRVRTHQQTVGAFLREAGLDLRPEDIVVPAAETPLEASQTIIVQQALPVLVEADGQLVEHFTRTQLVTDLLQEMGLNPTSHDAVFLNGQAVDFNAELPPHQWTPRRWPLLEDFVPLPAQAPAPSWLRLKLQRAIPLSINDNGALLTTYTLARTVGEALLSEDIILYVADRVQPMLGTLLTTGMHVAIVRAEPVTIQVDGRVQNTRAQARNVAQLLSEAGIHLVGKDYVVPSLDAEIVSDMSVRVIRVIEAWLVESEDMPFETIWHPDDTLELDQYRTDHPGTLGVRKCRVRLVYEDGEEMQRTVADEWIERQPEKRVMSYGTRVVVRQLQAPQGTLRYWRKIRMLATSYNAPTAGKPLDHPQYGITRLGWRARKGIVAVDPRVVALGTEVYVPGYGRGTAADTGSAILGRRLDLCYDDDTLVLWKSWVDVYLLEPAPAPDEINWMLPNYPSYR